MLKLSGQQYNSSEVICVKILLGVTFNSRTLIKRTHKEMHKILVKAQKQRLIQE